MLPLSAPATQVETPDNHTSFSQPALWHKKQATRENQSSSDQCPRGFTSAPISTPFPVILVHGLIPWNPSLPKRTDKRPHHSVFAEGSPGAYQNVSGLLGNWGAGAERVAEFNSKVIGNNEAVPPSSQPARGAECPGFQIGCPSLAAEITGHGELQANCFDKAVTVVRVQGCRPLGQRLPIKQTEKAAH